VLLYSDIAQLQGCW